MCNKSPMLSVQCLLGYAWLGLALPASIASANGGIATDGTMGAAQTLGGNFVTIPQSLGSTAGNNLFHSFAKFNIATGQTVEFTGSDTLQNVISRVTGPDATSIDGMLKSSIANAAFYFINPNGVTFGANASVDVPGAFHVGAADKIDFPNGGVYFADGSHASTLSSETPTAFGFLGSSAANNGLLAIDGAHLEVKPAQKLELAAKQIRIENAATLSAPGGQIRLATLANAGTPTLVQSGAGNPSPTNQSGRISIDNSRIDTEGDKGGRIELSADDVFLENSRISSINTGISDAGVDNGIAIQTHTMNSDNTWVGSAAANSGAAADITVAAETVHIVNGGQLFSDTYSGGHAGNLRITTNSLSINSLGSVLYPTGIFSHANTGSTGNAGNLTITAGTLDIINGQMVSATIASGDAGSIQVAANQLNIIDSGQITSATFSNGNAGDVRVAAKSLNIDSFSAITSTSDQNSSGHAGNLAMHAETLTLRQGLLSTVSLGQGNAGDIVVDAKQGVHLLNGGKILSVATDSGKAGNITIKAGQLAIAGGKNSTQINSAANNGTGGDINVNIAGDMAIRGSGSIDASTYGAGNGGDIRVHAANLSIDGQKRFQPANISSSTQVNATGNSGNISVDVPGRLSLVRGGRISSVSFSNALGDAGNIEVTAGNLIIDGHRVAINPQTNLLQAPTGIFSEATQAALLPDSGSGEGGDVRLTITDNMKVMAGGLISADTFGSKNAGAIDIAAGNLLIEGQSRLNGQYFFPVTGIRTESGPFATGNAGDISLDITGELSLIRGAYLSSTSASLFLGDAGKINVAADKLVIDADGSGALTAIISASFNPKDHYLDTGTNQWVWLPGIPGSGASGGISVKTSTLSINGGAIFSETYGTGNAGKMIFNARQLELTQGGTISSSTTGAGKAGDILISGLAGGETRLESITIDGNDDNFTASLPKNGLQGTGETVTGQPSGIYLNTAGKGDSGNLSLYADHVNLSDGGEISAIAGRGPAFAKPRGGSIDIRADTVNLTGGGTISASTSGPGNAGEITVNADKAVFISGHFDRNRHSTFTNYRIFEQSAITSNATRALDPGAAKLGKGGSVSVSAPLLTLDDGGKISVSTEGDKKAGNVNIFSAKLSLSDQAEISAASNGAESSGKTGHININATDSVTLVNQGKISIENAGIAADSEQITPGDITINTPDIAMQNSEVTTLATGNVGAGNININSNGLVSLQNSSFKTTVKGANSNGGNIMAKANILLMETGLIQANAVNGFGGDITLNLKALIPSNNTLILGGAAVGWRPSLTGLNVVQAASEKGLSGTLSVTSPQLNLSGILAIPGNPQFDTRSIAQDYCELDTGSSLISKGSGGLKPKRSDLSF